MVSPCRWGVPLWLCFTAASACSLMLGACATLQVPSKAPSFPFEKCLNASREGVVVRAYPIEHYEDYWQVFEEDLPKIDRKSTRLNSSHTVISYAVFCLKKKKNKNGCRGDYQL